ncbi:MAG: Rne/Rng family ribonuclease, partial [Elusimicrobia bacterium]|nr:Rne/Rng family ribonuclease [Elusimicrobiota bacterium]
MKQEIIANCTPEETRIAVIEDSRLVELGIERKESEKIVGNIYKGKVENVLPGISSAFVSIGLEKNAYLYISDVLNQSPTAPSSSTNKPIDQILKRGDVILVQIAKEAIGTKGVKVSMDISLPGRFLVYMPYQNSIGVSKNIEDEPERRRLKDLLESHRPKQGGFIARTESEGIEERDMKREIRYLCRLWENIQRRSANVVPGNLVHKDLGLVFQTVRDILSEDTAVFMIDSKSEQEEVLGFVQMLSPDLADRIQYFDSKVPIFEAFNVEKELQTLLSSRISLPSGGTIIVQEAESLCAIDVNTGKFTGKESQEETVTQTNIEAAEEIARQLRLRNIGGIIVIDFIDMRRARNRQKVVETLHRATSRDRAKIKILPITRLGLVEMTRERKRESILSTLSQTCWE